MIILAWIMGIIFVVGLLTITGALQLIARRRLSEGVRLAADQPSRSIPR